MMSFLSISPFTTFKLHEVSSHHIHDLNKLNVGASGPSHEFFGLDLQAGSHQCESTTPRQPQHRIESWKLV